MRALQIGGEVARGLAGHGLVHQAHLAIAGVVHARDHVEEGALACTIGADQCVHFRSEAKLREGLPVMGWSIRRTSPSLGSSTPEIMLKKVLLPAPLGPINACTSDRRRSCARACRSWAGPSGAPRHRWGRPRPRSC